MRFLPETDNLTIPDGNGLRPPRERANPEYLVNERFVDAAVVGNNPQSAIDTAFDKVIDGQTQRVDIVLDASTAKIDDVEAAFLATDVGTWISEAADGVEGGRRLIELTVLKDGDRRTIYFADPLLGG